MVRTKCVFFVRSRGSGNPGPLAESLQCVALGPRFRGDERWRLLRETGEAIKRALQDEGGGVLVDHLGALLTADVGLDQLTLDCHGREPLVPQGDRQLGQAREIARDRKSTRLNSSHVAISYAVFCLKK